MAQIDGSFMLRVLQDSSASGWISSTAFLDLCNLFAYCLFTHDFPMNHYALQWIEDWCQENGWTDLFQECSLYWAFPPNAVMPVPIPTEVLQSIKAERGLCREEQLWCLAAISSAIVAGICSYVLASPLPLVLSFAFCAVIVGNMEEDSLETTPNYF
jgi:hypothetical protein